MSWDALQTISAAKKKDCCNVNVCNHMNDHMHLLYIREWYLPSLGALGFTARVKPRKHSSCFVLKSQRLSSRLGISAAEYNKVNICFESRNKEKTLTHGVKPQLKVM